jgi:hypothetical protein
MAQQSGPRGSIGFRLVFFARACARLFLSTFALASSYFVLLLICKKSFRQHWISGKWPCRSLPYNHRRTDAATVAGRVREERVSRKKIKVREDVQNIVFSNDCSSGGSKVGSLSHLAGWGIKNCTRRLGRKAHFQVKMLIKGPGNPTCQLLAITTKQASKS